MGDILSTIQLIQSFPPFIFRWEESEDLGQSGLSDTVEILDELVREGYLSLPDLDWTIPQTEQDRG